MFSINKTLTISALMIFPLILGIVSLFGGKWLIKEKHNRIIIKTQWSYTRRSFRNKCYKNLRTRKCWEEEFNIHNNAYQFAIKLQEQPALFSFAQGISSISLLILLGLGTFQLEVVLFQ